VGFFQVIVAEITFALQCVYKWLDFFHYTVIMETAWYRASEEYFFFIWGQCGLLLVGILLATADLVVIL